jgi:serine/threonine-protein kinase HipA
VIDQHGQLAIAKFPKENDDYSIELWETVALQLAAKAGILTPKNELLSVAGKPVLLSHRFDRADGNRVPFLSAMAMMGMKDGEHGSYPELVDVLTRNGSQVGRDVRELYRRMAFNVLISNVDDHLRNHGFLWASGQGWSLSPAYDLNPTPVDIRQRILTTNISLDDGTCDIDLVLSVAELFSLTAREAKTIVKEVGTTTAKWRRVATAQGARMAEIQRMESAFEHADLTKALAL